MLKNPLDLLADPTARKLARLRLIIAGLIFGGVLLCSGVILAGQFFSHAAGAPAQATQAAALEALRPLKDLCLGGGGGQAQAARYSPGAGPHRLAVFRSNIAGSTDLSTFFNRTEDYPAEWQAADLAQAELVACVHTASAVVEECAYQLAGGAQATLQRVQFSALINLYAARTGELIGQGAVPGPEPRACQAQEQFPQDTLTQAVFGEAAPPAQIQAWLSDYVE